MTGYIIRRLAILPFTLFVVSFFTFAVARFGPGDPITVTAGQIRDKEVLERIRAERGLDGSIAEQYVRWFGRAVQGDFGESYIQKGYSVRELIVPKMLVSAQLNVLSIFFVFVIGIPLGLMAAWFQGKWLDPVIIASLLFLSAIPVLVIIPPLQWLLSVRFNIIPVGGWGGLIDIYWIAGVIAIPIPDPHLYLPVMVLTIPGFAGVARLVRVTALQVSSEDYVRTARAKGLKESTVAVRHVLPNSLLPLVTVVGLSLADILSGAYFTETLLGIPGIGAFTFESVRSRDYDVIMATTLIVAFFFIVMNLMTDLAYAVIDPTRASRRENRDVTTATPSVGTSTAVVPQSRGPMGLFWQRLRRKRLAMLSLLVIAVIYGGGIFAPVLAPYSYTEQNLDNALQAPSAEHWFGTDRLGRDMFSRTLYSARTTLVVSVAVLISGSLVIGNGLGLLAGYRGGWVDNVIMRVGEILSALPGLPMLILVNAALGPRVQEFVAWLQQGAFVGGVVRDFASYMTVFAALSLFFWVGTARIIRAQVLQLRERDFVTAARALGGSTRHILWRHLLPNIAFLVILQLSGTLGGVAGSEIALTWFGVGVQPPTPSFGAMIYEGSGARNFQTHPHLLLVPGMTVSALLFAFVLLGDAINDVIRDR